MLAHNVNTAEALVLLMLLLGAAASAQAGALRDFEKKATEKPTTPKKSGSTPPAPYSRHGGFWYDDYGHYPRYRSRFHPLYFGVPACAHTATKTQNTEEPDFIYLEHQSGAFTMPTIRADIHWSEIDADTDALNIRMEGGYRMFAASGQWTRYIDHSDDFTLDLPQVYGMLRAGGSSPNRPRASFEAALGFGVASLRGDETNSGAALTIPLKYYPTDWMGLEFRPAWYRPVEKVISDYDASVSFGSNYFQVRVGYRWLWLQGSGSELEGFYMGCGFSL